MADVTVHTSHSDGCSSALDGGGGGAGVVAHLDLEHPHTEEDQRRLTLFDQHHLCCQHHISDERPQNDRTAVEERWKIRPLKWNTLKTQVLFPNLSTTPTDSTPTVSLSPSPPSSSLSSSAEGDAPAAECKEGPCGYQVPCIACLADHLFCQGLLHKQDVLKIITQATDIFRKEKNVLDMKAPLTLVGDIHGQFYDLVRILEHGTPPSDGGRWLFLGDYVDRGSFSVEVMLLLLALKSAYPTLVYMLRGNHESRVLSEHFTFKKECLSKYDIHVYEAFILMFQALPLAACIDTPKGTFFAVHGGLSPSLWDVDEIRNNIDRFVEVPKEGAMCDLLWSDPIETDTGQGLEEDDLEEWFSLDYVPNPTRGVGQVFGWRALENWLASNDLLCVIRAHEVQLTGYEEHTFFQDDRDTPAMFTLFSAPNYCNMYGNQGAIMMLDQTGSHSFHQFDAAPQPSTLPKCQNAVTYTLPTILDDLCECVENIGKGMFGEDDDDDDDDDDENGGVGVGDGPAAGDGARDKIRRKILAVGRLHKMMVTLRSEQDSVRALKELSGGSLPPNTLLGGAERVREVLLSFEQAYALDIVTEKHPGIDAYKAVTDGDGSEPLPIHSLHTLQTDPPHACDRTHLEKYLSDDEFESAVGVVREEFYRLKQWKQQKIKKSLHLF